MCNRQASFDQWDGLLPGSTSYSLRQRGELHQPSVQSTYSSRQTVAFCLPWCLRSRRGLQSLWPRGKEKHFRAIVMPLCRGWFPLRQRQLLTAVQLFAAQINLLILFFLHRSYHSIFFISLWNKASKSTIHLVKTLSMQLYITLDYCFCSLRININSCMVHDIML